LRFSYQSSPSDWKKFAKWDSYKYTRNLVHEGNGKFNLMLLCWGEGNQSSIHDHANAHCFMKILDGGLREARYKIKL
jgi:cysteine dioxygenase